jgi:ubiquinone/menaquinone biosynthesis C-methylase UbiE
MTTERIAGRPGSAGERDAARLRYNRIAGIYDFLEILAERALRPWRQGLLARAEGRVLEVGIGTGKNFPYYPPGVAITGIDIAENMLAAARKKAAGQGVRVDLILADVQDLPFPDDVFDSAVSTFVFCSVPDPVRGLREVRRVLRPEGQILLLEHMQDGRTESGVLSRFLGRFAGNLLGAGIRNRMSLGHLRRAGLLVESVECLRKEEKVESIVARPDKARSDRRQSGAVTM